MSDKMTAAPVLIKGAKVWLDGEFRCTDLRVADGVVNAIAPDIMPEEGDMIVDGKGRHLIPGLVDLHVHFREPGFSYKETIAAGSRAAAKGGFTTVCTMPNLKPAPDSVENLKKQLDIISDDAQIEVLPFATITRQRLGHECVDYKALLPYVAGFSDDGTGVQDADVMRRSMEGIAEVDGLLAAHCEVESLLNKGYIHDGEYARAHGHRGICSESEWGEVKRDIELAAATGCRLHICHVSTKESVELVREAKRKGLKVTCETGPHYLAFTDADLQEDGRFKMNPPIRSGADREALRRGIADGTVDVVATDHAPHSAEEKAKGLEKSAMGVVGLETSLPAVYTYMVKPGHISLGKLVEVMADNPRRILGRDPEIKEGSRADLTLVDFSREWTVDPESFLTLGRATPFNGCKLKGEIMLTLFGGAPVFSHPEL